MELWSATLRYDGLYDWEAAAAFLARRAIDGVERVESNIYRRTVRHEDLTGTIAVENNVRSAALLVTGRALAGRESIVTERVRRMFDLDADVTAIGARLGHDPAIAPLVAMRPAVRVFRGWDGFEVAVRSIIGQQVTVERARQLNGMLVERCGSVLPRGSGDGLRRLFPTARQVLEADLSLMGMPGARVNALKSVARAALADPDLFARAASVEQTIARLRTIGGVGDWTAHYIAMRACGEPDAFPVGDVGLLRAAASMFGRRPTPDELLARADAWRPWRAYAAHHLWALDGASGSSVAQADSSARDGVSRATVPVIVEGRQARGSGNDYDDERREDH